MENTGIKVTTIDYYTRDQMMNITCGELPKKLHRINKSYINNPQSPTPPVNLNAHFPDYGAGEHHMESLLKYINQKPWTLQNHKIQFVTNKHLLKYIASGDYESIEVEVGVVNGVIYMLKSKEEENNNVKFMNFGKAFEHFMTENSGNFQAENVTKAVFVAEIPGEKSPFKVLYSGEIDAIDENFHHYELKVLSGGITQHFWKKKSCQFYWQSVLSNVETMIIGSRTGKHPMWIGQFCYPAYSLYEVKTLPIKGMPSEATKSMITPWTIQEGQKRLHDFLHKVHGTVGIHGSSAIFSKTRTDTDWTIKRIDMANSSLYSHILKSKIFAPIQNPAPSNRVLGTIETHPDTKMVFFTNGCHSISKSLKIINTSTYRIGFEAKFKSNKFRLIQIRNSFGALDPGQSIFLYIEYQSSLWDHGGIGNDRIIIEWIDLSDKEELFPGCFDKNGLFRKKVVLVDFVG